MSDPRAVEVKTRPAHEIVRIAAILILLLLSVFGVAYLVSPTSRQAITEIQCRTGQVLAHSYNQAAPDDSKSGSIAYSSASTLKQAPVAKGSNLLSNPGAETVLTRNNPDSWKTAAPDTLKAAFSLVDGHDSPYAFRVDVSAYTSGAADWYTDDIRASGGKYYEFSDYYRSNIPTRTIMTYTDVDGDQRYINLRSTKASASWQPYVERFFVPDDAVSFNVFHIINAKGFLETDDYNLAEATPSPLERGLVSITFDDGWRSSYTSALPIMERYHVVSTQFIISGFVGAPAYLKASQVYAFQRAGHEVASHSVSHLDLTAQTTEVASHQLKDARDQLSQCFGPVTAYAAPYGAYNDAVLDLARPLYRSYRSTDTGYNTLDQFDPYNVVVQNVEAGTPTRDIAAWVDVARRNQVWLVLVYHQVDKSGGLYSRTPQNFEADIKAIKAAQIAVKTYSDAFGEVQRQIK